MKESPEVAYPMPKPLVEAPARDGALTLEFLWRRHKIGQRTMSMDILPSVFPFVFTFVLLHLMNWCVRSDRR